MTPAMHIHTPLLVHRRLSARLGKQVMLKMKNLQPSGFVKLRGIGVDLDKLALWNTRPN